MLVLSMSGYLTTTLQGFSNSLWLLAFVIYFQYFCQYYNRERRNDFREYLNYCLDVYYIQSDVASSRRLWHGDVY